MSFVRHSLYRPYWYLLASLAAANRSLTMGSPGDATAVAAGPEEAKNPVGLDEEAETAAGALLSDE